MRTLLSPLNNNYLLAFIWIIINLIIQFLLYWILINYFPTFEIMYKNGVKYDYSFCMFFKTIWLCLLVNILVYLFILITKKFVRYRLSILIAMLFPIFELIYLTVILFDMLIEPCY